jgi:DDE superfamily endonuclease/helix-turn-helix, Psq domain
MDTEERIQAAMEAIKSKKASSLRKAAEMFRIPRSTLRDRIAGCQPLKTSKQHLQRLSPEEEGAIERTILQMSVWGWPMTITSLEALARELLDKKGDFEPLGQNWHDRFLVRHPDLKKLRSRAMDQSRKDATDYETARQWFELFQTIRLLYDIDDVDIYNMDEKGCMKGVGENVKVLVSRSDAEAFSAQPGNREWVSIIECIGGTGYTLPPFIIFEGKRIQLDWTDALVDKRTVIQVSPNGWTDREIALTWIQHFDKYTALGTQGLYRLLILDGHASHVSFEFVQYCQDHNIVPLCLSPHSTHYLQPLDVGVFGPVAHEYRLLVTQGSVFGAERITNLDFLHYYQTARKSIAKNALAAWRGAGLIPFNSNKILQPLRPKTPPTATLTDEAGRTIRLPVDGELAVRINKVVSDLLDTCASPLKHEVLFVKNAALTAIADRATLQSLNQGLVEKTSTWRKKHTAKHCGEARVLTVEEIQNKRQEIEAKEAEEQLAKKRRSALKGKVGFAKLVWKELSMDFNIFE